MRRGVQGQPDHVADLGLKLRIGGELERLGLPGLEVVLGHTRAMVLWLIPSWSAHSRIDQWVTPRCSGGGARVVARISPVVSDERSGGGLLGAGRPGLR